MATYEPYDHLVGPLTVYIGPVGETVPDVDSTPAGNWVELGETDGEQSIEHVGELTFFSDNDHQGNVKAARHFEDVIARFTLVGLTLEHYARILDEVGDVATDAGPPATKTLAFKRGNEPYLYAMLLKGSTLSPYGAYPGMYVIPKGLFGGNPQPTFGKDQRAGLAIEFHALEDDDQTSGDELGWLVVQTS